MASRPGLSFAFVAACSVAALMPRLAAGQHSLSTAVSRRPRRWSGRDRDSTPFGTSFGGEEPIWGITVHAHITDQLIRAAMGGAPSLRGLSRGGEDLWIWGWAMAGMALGLLVRYPIPAAGGSALGVLVLAGAVYQVFGMALFLPAVPAAIAWVGSAGLTNRIMYAASNRARALLRRSFEHYLPLAVIAQMLASEALPKLGGERREISVVFTDVAGFTTFSESVEPEFLASMCNDYFEGYAPRSSPRAAW